MSSTNILWAKGFISIRNLYLLTFIFYNINFPRVNEHVQIFWGPTNLNERGLLHVVGDFRVLRSKNVFFGFGDAIISDFDCPKIFFQSGWPNFFPGPVVTSANTVIQHWCFRGGGPKNLFLDLMIQFFRLEGPKSFFFAWRFNIDLSGLAGQIFGRN